MNIENYTKKIYNTFGLEYQELRDFRTRQGAYNEFLEMPAMINTLGNIKGKKILDLGCGAGAHAMEYVKKEADVCGLDISKTLVKIAKKRCPQAKFTVGSMNKIPYEDNTFDIVTASLSIHYIKDLNKLLHEVNRVLKKNGLFIYSTYNPIYATLESYEDDNLKIFAVGEINIKKSQKKIYLGRDRGEKLKNWNMFPGMTVKNYRRPLRTYLHALQKNDLELQDVIECKPTKEFKKYNAPDYEWVKSCTVFNIYVTRKKWKR
jgi:ubiquinone/menaquinone biosynthesis C-methylase UbiE